MKSPFTGKDMEVVYETRTWNFRGEQYEYTHAAYRCVDTGEQFTSEEMEEAAYLQVANQYRKKHGLPFTDEIVDTLFNYYLEHQESLVKEYEGKYLIITNEGVVGAYDSLNEGYEVALKT